MSSRIDLLKDSVSVVFLPLYLKIVDNSQ